MGKSDIINDIFNKTEDESSNYFSSDGIELYITSNEKHRKTNSISDEVKLFIKWLSASSFYELSFFSGSKYHLLLNLSKIKKNDSYNFSDIDRHKFYYYSNLDPQKWLYRMMILLQKIFYFKIGFQQILLLKDYDGVNGELIKKGKEYFIAYHSNHKNSLKNRGATLLQAI